MRCYYYFSQFLRYVLISKKARLNFLQIFAKYRTHGLYFGSRQLVCFLLFGVSAFFLFGITVVSAAEMAIRSEVSNISLDQEFQVDVYLSAQKENINALEGVISFPTYLLQLNEVRDGDSVVNFWIKRPKLPEKDTISEIIFSGVVVGGYRGNNGKLFSLIFKAEASGSGIIAIEKARAFLNDGKATVAQLELKNYSIRVKKVSADSIREVASVSDSIPPEPFDPIITKDPNLYAGKYALIFNAQDKGSGIDHYEVREGNGVFERAASPYVLRNQNMNAPIVVRAYDKAGNTRDAFYAPPTVQDAQVKPVVPLSPQNQLPLLVIIGIILTVYFAMRLRKH